MVDMDESYKMDWDYLWRNNVKARDWYDKVKNDTPSVVIGYLFERINRYGETARILVSYIKYAMAMHFMPIADYIKLFMTHFGNSEDWLFKNKTVFEQLFIEISRYGLRKLRVSSFLDAIPKNYPTYYNLIKIKDVHQRKRKRREIPVEKYFSPVYNFNDIQQTVILVLHQIAKYALQCKKNDQVYDIPTHALEQLLRNLTIRMLLLYKDAIAQPKTEYAEFLAVMKELLLNNENTRSLAKALLNYGLFINCMFKNEKYRVPQITCTPAIKGVLSMMIDETNSSMAFGSQCPKKFATRLTHFAQYHSMPMYQLFMICYEITLEKVLKGQRSHLSLICTSFLYNTLPIMLEIHVGAFQFNDLLSESHDHPYELLKNHISSLLINYPEKVLWEKRIFTSILMRTTSPQLRTLLTPYFMKENLSQLLESNNLTVESLKQFHIQWEWIRHMDHFMANMNEENINRYLPRIRRFPPLLSILHAQAKVFPLLEALITWLFQFGVLNNVNVIAFKNVFVAVYFIMERHEIFEDDENKRLTLAHLQKSIQQFPSDLGKILAAYYFSLLKNYGRVQWTHSFPESMNHIIITIPRLLRDMNREVTAILNAQKPATNLSLMYIKIFNEYGQFATILFWQGLYAIGHEGISFHMKEDLKIVDQSKKMFNDDMDISVPMIQRLIEPVRCANLATLNDKFRRIMGDILKQHHELVPNFIVIKGSGDKSIQEMYVRFESGIELFKEANNLFKLKYKLLRLTVTNSYNVTPFEMFALASKKMSLHQFCDLIMHQAQMDFVGLSEAYATVFMRCVGYPGFKILLERYAMSPHPDHLHFIFACLVHHSFSSSQKVDLASFFLSILQRHAVRCPSNSISLINSFFEKSFRIAYILRDIFSHLDSQKFFLLMQSLFHLIPVHLHEPFVSIFNIFESVGTNQLLALTVLELYPTSIV